MGLKTDRRNTWGSTAAVRRNTRRSAKALPMFKDQGGPVRRTCEVVNGITEAPGDILMKSHSIFPGAAHSTSLGFGTTSFMGLPTTGDRLGLLEAAFHAGIRHFDTAPYYGYGEAERVLGDFARGKRDQLTIATKYGIEPPAIIRARWANLLARRVLRAAPPLKRFFSRKAQQMTTHAAFSPAAARKSLDRSLLALQTDRVDLLLLHEPTFEDAASGEMQQYLDEKLKRGRIRAYGCGGRVEPIKKIASADLPTAEWLQFEDSVLDRNIEVVRPNGGKCITFRTFQSALPELREYLEANAARRLEWQAQLQMDLGQDRLLAELLLASSMSRNAGGIVLFSTRRAERIRSAVEVASGDRFTEDQVRTFTGLATQAFPRGAAQAGKSDVD